MIESTIRKTLRPMLFAAAPELGYLKFSPKRAVPRRY